MQANHLTDQRPGPRCRTFACRVPRMLSVTGLCTFLLLVLVPPAAAEPQTLIAYYSRTGNCRSVCETLRQHLAADVVEIRDQKDRSGRWGYTTAAFDAFFDRTTAISPAQTDLTPYATIILLSPVWNWKLSVPIRTFISSNRLAGKDLIFITTGNNDVMKYAAYGDDAPFIKRFLKNYLHQKCEEMKAVVAATGGNIAGYHHIATKDRTADDILTDVLTHTYEIRDQLDAAATHQNLAVR